MQKKHKWIAGAGVGALVFTAAVVGGWSWMTRSASEGAVRAALQEFLPGAAVSFSGYEGGLFSEELRFKDVRAEGTGGSARLERLALRRGAGPGFAQVSAAGVQANLPGGVTLHLDSFVAKNLTATPAGLQSEEVRADGLVFEHQGTGFALTAPHVLLSQLRDSVPRLFQALNPDVYWAAASGREGVKAERLMVSLLRGPQPDVGGPGCFGFGCPPGVDAFVRRVEDITFEKADVTASGILASMDSMAVLVTGRDEFGPKVADFHMLRGHLKSAAPGGLLAVVGQGLGLSSFDYTLRGNLARTRGFQLKDVLLEMPGVAVMKLSGQAEPSPAGPLFREFVFRFEDKSLLSRAMRIMADKAQIRFEDVKDAVVRHMGDVSASSRPTGVELNRFLDRSGAFEMRAKLDPPVLPSAALALILTPKTAAGSWQMEWQVEPFR